LAAAIDYVTEAGYSALERHERELTSYALGRLGEVPGLRLYGPPLDRRVGIVSFSLEGVHPHDVAQVVDAEGVAVRAGHHCNQPLMAKLGVNATTRASFYLYTLPAEIDRLVDGLHRARNLFS
jgi:cysteine desulfurase/selenocysteine lyase